MENVIRPDTKGKIEEIDAKYELLQRGQYQHLANPLALKADRRLPLEIYEARNAVSIARGMGADRFAAETFQKAEKSLSEAEAYQARNAGMKPVAMTAREAVQMAEDARAIAVKRQEDDALTAERQQSGDRTARAESGQAAAQSETDRVTREADRARRDNDSRMAAASIEASRLKLENQWREAAAKTEADHLRVENDSRMAAAGAEADRLKRDNDAQRAASQSDLDSANQQKAQLLANEAQLRVELLKQFNVILQTRDTARGLIVNMSDVLFDTGKSTLRPLAREKLAKVAGIVAGHPGLRLDVEGHTDSVGGDDYNQTLSEQRGESVRDYLTHEGMATDSVTTKGFGKTQPVATNDTAEGRQQNRRVELVISGEVIGTVIGKVIAARE
jgi:outer membrane protein OmpA-like peptidoglycan-associated protein